MKQMSDKWLKGISMQGYGTTLAVGVGIPIPILNEEMAAYTGVSNDDLITQVVDYSYDYSHQVARNYGEVSYAQLNTGEIEVNGQKVRTAPLSSVVKARRSPASSKNGSRKGIFCLQNPCISYRTNNLAAPRPSSETL